MKVMGKVAIAVALLGLAACGDGGNGGTDVTNKAMVEKGKTLYAANCASCHGKNLEGEAKDWRAYKEDGTLPAPPHDETGHTWHHPDKLLFDYIKEGGAAIAPKGFKSAMPGFKSAMSDEDIWAILSFIKSQWPDDVQKKQAGRNQ